MSPTKPVLVERAGAIATVVLGDGGNRNALTGAAWRRLAEAMPALAADETLRCVVLRGAGDQAFSVGADLTEFAGERSSAEQARAYSALLQDALQSVAACRHPTVALIQGVCQAEALALAAVCDVRVASESASFSLPAGRHAAPMGAAELAPILSLAGQATTLEMLLEGRTLCAADAYRRRLVNRVAPDAEAEAYAVAGRIAAGAPLAARWNKQFVARLAVGSNPHDALSGEGFAIFDSEDFRAGIDAALSNAEPRFKGR